MHFDCCECRPAPEHELAEDIRQRSKLMAEQATKCVVTGMTPL